MHYVYILKSARDGKLYVGRSDNLKRRYEEHKKGKVRATKNRRPLLLLFYEAFCKKEDSVRRERYFKTSKGKSSLRMMLRESIK